jgi:hypothetical protein
MALAQLRMSWQPPQVSLHSNFSRPEVTVEEVPDVRSEQAQVRVHSTGPRLRLDNSATRAALDFRTNAQFLDQRLGWYRQASVAAIDTVVAEGHRLGAIETGERNAIANLARDLYVDTSIPEIKPRALPGPDVSIEPRTVDLEWVGVGGPTGAVMRVPHIRWTGGAPEVDFALSPVNVELVGGAFDASA